METKSKLESRNCKTETSTTRNQKSKSKAKNEITMSTTSQNRNQKANRRKPFWFKVRSPCSSAASAVRSVCWHLRPHQPGFALVGQDAKQVQVAKQQSQKGNEHRKAQLQMEKASSEIEAAKDNESPSVRLQNDAKQEWVVVLADYKENHERQRRRSSTSRGKRGIYNCG